MGLIRKYGKPDLFITMTCNPQWDEIVNELKNVENSDKLTIIARVFRIKLNELLDDILKKRKQRTIDNLLLEENLSSAPTMNRQSSLSEFLPSKTNNKKIKLLPSLDADLK